MHYYQRADVSCGLQQHQLFVTVHYQSFLNAVHPEVTLLNFQTNTPTPTIRPFCTTSTQTAAVALVCQTKTATVIFFQPSVYAINVSTHWFGWQEWKNGIWPTFSQKKVTHHHSVLSRSVLYECACHPQMPTWGWCTVKLAFRCYRFPCSMQ